MLDGLPGTDVLSAGDLGLGPRALDPLKLVVDVAGLGSTGVEVERLLRERYAVAVEGSDLCHLFLVASAGGGAAEVGAAGRRTARPHLSDVFAGTRERRLRARAGSPSPGQVAARGLLRPRASP